MSFAADARLYWDRKAEGQSFAHPLNLEWLANLPKTARILDYGCGYGRIVAELATAGWREAVGVDFSPAMIERGRREQPGLDLRCVLALPLDEPAESFDAVLVFAVLTTIMADEDQDALMAELRRVLKPKGLLYLSDYPLQTDDRYLARYAAGLDRYGVHGVWDREDGGVFRHQSRERLDALLAGFDILDERKVATATLSGFPAVAIQVLASRPAAES
ncbi:MAG: class I SAM-dependent methyltransferase [Caulobacteraceae bacterium]